MGRREPKDKGLSPKYQGLSPEHRGLVTCGHRRRAVNVPAAAVQPVVVPAPLVDVPVEVANDQGATPVAVDGSPEEHHLTLPGLRDEVLVLLLQEIIQHVGVLDRLVLELLTQLVSNDRAILLLLREPQLDLGQIPLHQLPALDVLLDGPAVREVWRGVAVDDVLAHDHLCLTTQDREQSREHVAGRELLDVARRPAIASKRELEFRRLRNTHHRRVTHVTSLL